MVRLQWSNSSFEGFLKEDTLKACRVYAGGHCFNGAIFQPHPSLERPRGLHDYPLHTDDLEVRQSA